MLHTIEITHCSVTRSKKITPIFSIVYQIQDKIEPYKSERKKVACIYVFINELCPFKQRITLYFPSISLFWVLVTPVMILYSQQEVTTEKKIACKYPVTDKNRKERSHMF